MMPAPRSTHVERTPLWVVRRLLHGGKASHILPKVIYRACVIYTKPTTTTTFLCEQMDTAVGAVFIRNARMTCNTARDKRHNENEREEIVFRMCMYDIRYQLTEMANERLYKGFNGERGGRAFNMMRRRREDMNWGSLWCDVKLLSLQQRIWQRRFCFSSFFSSNDGRWWRWTRMSIFLYAFLICYLYVMFI